MVGVEGFEPSECQSQNLMPYPLATPQYEASNELACLSQALRKSGGTLACDDIISYILLDVKPFLKIFLEIFQWSDISIPCAFPTSFIQVPRLKESVYSRGA